MLDIISSAVLVVSLGIILAVFLRKRPALSELDEGDFNLGKQRVGVVLSKKLEEWDNKINVFAEFFLRRFRMILLKGDNMISHWLFSLRKNNHNGSDGTFFLGESIDSKPVEEKPDTTSAKGEEQTIEEGEELIIEEEEETLTEISSESSDENEKKTRKGNF